MTFNFSRRRVVLGLPLLLTGLLVTWFGHAGPHWAPAAVQAPAAVDVPGTDGKVQAVCDGGTRIYYIYSAAGPAIAVTLDRNACP